MPQAQAASAALIAISALMASSRQRVGLPCPCPSRPVLGAAPLVGVVWRPGVVDVAVPLVPGGEESLGDVEHLALKEPRSSEGARK
jgi:hypothetical protein